MRSKGPNLRSAPCFRNARVSMSSATRCRRRRRRLQPRRAQLRGKREAPEGRRVWRRGEDEGASAWSCTSRRATPPPRPPPRPRVKACAALASRLLLCAGVARNGAAAAVPRGAGGVPRSGRAAGPAVHPILTRCSRPRVQAAPQPAGRTSGPHLRSTRRTAHTRGSAVELWGHAYPPTNAQTARGARGGPRTGFALATTAKPDLCIRRKRGGPWSEVSHGGGPW